MFIAYGVKGQYSVVAMGVKDLWKILSKAKKKLDIKELQGKTLAVDLSCWVCRFSSVKGTSV